MSMSSKYLTAEVELLLDIKFALPCVLIGFLLLILGVKSFLSMMDSIQSQGYVPTEADYHPASAPDASNSAEGEPIDVVVKVVKLRRNLILGLFYSISVTYALGAAIDIISTLINNQVTLDARIALYSIGDLIAFAACAIAMSLQERRSNKPAGWGTLYPRAFAALSFIGEIGIMILSINILHRDPSRQPASNPLPVVRIVLGSLRLVLIALLILSQTSLLSKITFVSPSTLLSVSNDESTALLADAEGYGSTDVKAKRTLLRSTRPPSSRPKDPKSLSLLTLFARVKLLFPYLWPKESLSLQVLAVVCVSLMLLKRFVNVAVPVLFGLIIQDLVEGESPYVDISLYVLANFLGDSNTMLYRYLWLPIDQYSERSMAIRSYECLLNLSLSYHTKRKTGEMLRILDRSDAINNFFETLIFTFLPILFDLPIAFLYLSYKFGGLIVGTVSIVAIIFVTTSVVLAESRTKLYRSLRDEDQFMRAIKTDVLLQYETVKIFTAEGFESDRLRNAMRVYQKGYWNVYSAWNSLSLIQDSISAIGLLVCAFILANRVIKGEIGVGDFVTFTSYLGQLYGPLNKIAGLYRTVMSNLVDTEQLMELLAEEKEIVDQPGATDLVIERGSPKTTIEFDNVRFSYDGKKDTIKGVSFKVPSGSSVALVGPSGSGKSTIIKLLYRFYELKEDEGSIKIAGQDIRSYTQLSLRRAIGLVPQSAALFNETIRFNISYGGDRLSNDAEIEGAAKSAAIHDRILSFPDQYETRVGERGQRLSGGEQQRVAIARVILKDSPILLLDEATSALDTTNERSIQRKLRELSEGRTTISIAHRLSTIVDCDIIFVLNEGVISERGSHSELLAMDGEYAALWKAQIQDGEFFSGTATPVA